MLISYNLLKCNGIILLWLNFEQEQLKSVFLTACNNVRFWVWMVFKKSVQCHNFSKLLRGRTRDVSRGCVPLDHHSSPTKCCFWRRQWWRATSQQEYENSTVQDLSSHTLWLQALSRKRWPHMPGEMTYHCPEYSKRNENRNEANMYWLISEKRFYS